MHELAEDHVWIELCTCFGEPVDLLRGADPELMEIVQTRRAGPPEL